MRLLHEYRIPVQSGHALEVKEGSLIKVINPEGGQVCDFVAFNLNDTQEWLSSGKTLDYAETIKITKGHTLYSNFDQPLLTIEEDTNGVNDFLLAPCSEGTMRHFYGIKSPHPTCFNNLVQHLEPFDISPGQIPVPFNIFMNVEISEKGLIKILPPVSQPGDYVLMKAKKDLLIGLTSCSAGYSNNFQYHPIDLEIHMP